jgi:hypothetical protein
MPVAWGMVLKGIFFGKIRYVDVFTVYLRSQVAKYLPGNLFHYVGRNLLAKHFGWPQISVAVTTFTEIVMLIIIAASFALMQIFSIIINIPYILYIVWLIATPLLVIISSIRLETCSN